MTLTDQVIAYLHAEAERQRGALDAARGIVWVHIELHFDRRGEPSDVQMSVRTRRSAQAVPR